MKRAAWMVPLLAAAVAALFLCLRSPAAAPPTLPKSPAPAIPVRQPLGSASKVAESNHPDTEAPFHFDPAQAIGPQVRGLLGGAEFPGRPVLTACREHSDAVVPALLAILHDPSAGYNVREQALGLLEFLGASSAVPDLFALARGDPDPRTRADAIRTLGAFPASITAAAIRGLFDAARTDDEKYRCVEVLGNLGDPASRPFLDELVRSHPDSLMPQLAREAAAKVGILNSAQKDVELVRILREEDHPLREWALNRIVGEKNSGLAHHLRDTLEAHRKLPRDRVSPSFELQLLVGLRTLGQDLRPGERAWLEAYSIETETPLPD